MARNNNGNIVRNYTQGYTRVKINDKYIGVTEEEKQDTADSLGATVQELWNEIASSDNIIASESKCKPNFISKTP